MNFYSIFLVLGLSYQQASYNFTYQGSDTHNGFQYDYGKYSDNAQCLRNKTDFFETNDYIDCFKQKCLLSFNLYAQFKNFLAANTQFYIDNTINSVISFYSNETNFTVVFYNLRQAPTIVIQFTDGGFTINSSDLSGTFNRSIAYSSKINQNGQYYHYKIHCLRISRIYVTTPLNATLYCCVKFQYFQVRAENKGSIQHLTHSIIALNVFENPFPVPFPVLITFDYIDQKNVYNTTTWMFIKAFGQPVEVQIQLRYLEKPIKVTINQSIMPVEIERLCLSNLKIQTYDLQQQIKSYLNPIAQFIHSVDAISCEFFTSSITVAFLEQYVIFNTMENTLQDTIFNFQQFYSTKYNDFVRFVNCYLSVYLNDGDDLVNIISNTGNINIDGGGGKNSIILNNQFSCDHQKRECSHNGSQVIVQYNNFQVFHSFVVNVTHYHVGASYETFIYSYGLQDEINGSAAANNVYIYLEIPFNIQCLSQKDLKQFYCINGSNITIFSATNIQNVVFDYCPNIQYILGEDLKLYFTQQFWDALIYRNLTIQAVGDFVPYDPINKLRNNQITVKNNKIIVKNQIIVVLKDIYNFFGTNGNDLIHSDIHGLHNIFPLMGADQINCSWIWSTLKYNENVSHFWLNSSANIVYNSKGDKIQDCVQFRLSTDDNYFDYHPNFIFIDGYGGKDTLMIPDTQQYLDQFETVCCIGLTLYKGFSMFNSTPSFVQWHVSNDSFIVVLAQQDPIVKQTQYTQSCLLTCIRQNNILLTSPNISRAIWLDFMLNTQNVRFTQDSRGIVYPIVPQQYIHAYQSHIKFTQTSGQYTLHYIEGSENNLEIWDCLGLSIALEFTSSTIRFILKQTNDVKISFISYLVLDNLVFEFTTLEVGEITFQLINEILYIQVNDHYSQSSFMKANLTFTQYVALDNVQRLSNKVEACQSISKQIDNKTNGFQITCACKDGQWYQRRNKTCMICHYSCRTCNNYSKSNCGTCPETRFLEANQCHCKAGYYNTKVIDCQQCDFRCQTCLDMSTKCTMCASVQLRELTPTNQCLCLFGYFEIENVGLCQKCDGNCLTCEGTALFCTSCQGSMVPTLTGQCFLKTCGERCATCKLGSAGECLECLISEYRLPSCECERGYLTLNDPAQCKSILYHLPKECDLRCQSCAGGVEICQSCAGLRQRPPVCICQSNMFTEQNLECQFCSYKCATCKDLDSCISCTQNRLLPPSCNCKPYFYEENNECRRNVFQNQLACNKRCSACNSADGCIKCSAPRTDLPLCLGCLPGYYSNQGSCAICSLQCLECKGSAQDCTKCSSFRWNPPACQCVTSYYQNANKCSPCQVHCLNCLNDSNCQICEDTHVLFQSDCYESCPSGYFTSSENGSKECLPCDTNCDYCSGSENQGCIICIEGHYSQNGVCVEQCHEGYYLNEQKTTCKSCSPSCLTCEGPYEFDCKTCKVVDLLYKRFCLSLCLTVQGKCAICAKERGSQCYQLLDISFVGELQTHLDYSLAQVRVRSQSDLRLTKIDGYLDFDQTITNTTTYEQYLNEKKVPILLYIEDLLPENDYVYVPTVNPQGLLLFNIILFKPISRIHVVLIILKPSQMVDSNGIEVDPKFTGNIVHLNITDLNQPDINKFGSLVSRTLQSNTTTMNWVFQKLSNFKLLGFFLGGVQTTAQFYFVNTLYSESLSLFLFTIAKTQLPLNPQFFNKTQPVLYLTPSWEQRYLQYGLSFDFPQWIVTIIIIIANSVYLIFNCLQASKTPATNVADFIIEDFISVDTKLFKFSAVGSMLSAILNETWFFQVWFMGLITFTLSFSTPIQKLFLSLSVIFISVNFLVELIMFIRLTRKLQPYFKRTALLRLTQSGVRFAKTMTSRSRVYFEDLDFKLISKLSYHFLTMAKKIAYALIIFSNKEGVLQITQLYYVQIVFTTLFLIFSPYRSCRKHIIFLATDFMLLISILLMRVEAQSMNTLRDSPNVSLEDLKNNQFDSNRVLIAFFCYLISQIAWLALCILGVIIDGVHLITNYISSRQNSNNVKNLNQTQAIQKIIYTMLLTQFIHSNNCNNSVLFGLSNLLNHKLIWKIMISVREQFSFHQGLLQLSPQSVLIFDVGQCSIYQDGNIIYITRSQQNICQLRFSLEDMLKLKYLLRKYISVNNDWRSFTRHFSKDKVQSLQTTQRNRYLALERLLNSMNSKHGISKEYIHYIKKEILQQPLTHLQVLICCALGLSHQQPLLTVHK